MCEGCGTLVEDGLVEQHQQFFLSNHKSQHYSKQIIILLKLNDLERTQNHLGPELHEPLTHIRRLQHLKQLFRDTQRFVAFDEHLVGFASVAVLLDELEEFVLHLFHEKEVLDVHAFLVLFAWPARHVATVL